jgi:glucose-1-phosphate cytidylyltransferase
VNDFIICCGYKGYVIKEYFANYFLHMSDVTFDMASNQMQVHQQKAEPWRVTLIDTGDDTLTGGRLKRVAGYVENEDAFCFTYGDGLSDVDISASLRFHTAMANGRRSRQFSRRAAMAPLSTISNRSPASSKNLAAMAV